MDVCKNCGEPIDAFPTIPVKGLQWKHSSGYYGCNRGQPRNPLTYAEPISRVPPVTPRSE